jgi:hypothetical protein
MVSWISVPRIATAPNRIGLRRAHHLCPSPRVALSFGHITASACLPPKVSETPAIVDNHGSSHSPRWCRKLAGAIIETHYRFQPGLDAAWMNSWNPTSRRRRTKHGGHCRHTRPMCDEWRTRSDLEAIASIRNSSFWKARDLTVGI